MREAADLMEGQMAAKGIRFRVDCAAERHCVLCDRSLLDRVVMNPLSNACKFTPEGGEVELSLRQTAAKPEGGRYEIRVKDNGIGMSPEFAEHVFQPFERERSSTVAKTQGTGLGMTISKKIVDLMGGEIRLVSAQGKGTEFTFSLELPYAEGLPGQPAGECSCRPDKTMRLLLAEDNPINREIATAILTDMGFLIETAEDGDQAVRKLTAAEPGYFQGVLMDIQMPVMDGYEAARTIRALPDERLAGIPIIAMTANAFKEDEEAAREAGMQGHIPKPLDVNVMRKTLKEVLGGEAK